MKVFMLIEVEDAEIPSGYAFNAEVFGRKMQAQMADDVRNSLEYAAGWTLVRVDVAGVDGVTEQSIYEEMPCPVLPERRHRVSCRDRDCVRCSSPPR